MNKIEVHLIAYSECKITKKRLATFTIKIPKFIWGHIKSHRALSSNSASSRAIPARKIRQKVLYSPFIPVYFGFDKPGMQSGDALKGLRLLLAKKIWLWARLFPVFFHYLGEKLGVHKEVINRIIEPWLVVDIIVSGTEWKNFMTLREHEAAQPEMQIVAAEIKSLLQSTKPSLISEGEWHLPFILDKEKKLGVETKKKISAARCARISYALFNGETSSVDNDIKLYEKLTSSGHWSPLEHQAQAMSELKSSGNFIGWKQFRKEFEKENNGDYKN
jgi:thymidylate synthase ThyX